MVCLAIALANLSDIIITVSLCEYLRKCKTGFERFNLISRDLCVTSDSQTITDTIIGRLIVYTINTGLLTMCVQFPALDMTLILHRIFNFAIIITVSSSILY